MMTSSRLSAFIAALCLLFAGSSSRAAIFTLDMPELLGTFTHGQAPLTTQIDFGTTFNPLWGMKIEITATGTPGRDDFFPDPIPAELLVSGMGIDGGHQLGPTTLGPYGSTPTADDVSGAWVYTMIFPLPSYPGIWTVTLDTPPDGKGVLLPATIEVLSATITANYGVPVFCSWPVPGDTDCNGRVGLADLNIVLTNWDKQVPPGEFRFGDFSGDGLVALEDLSMVLNNWDYPYASSAPLPEPGTLALLGVLCLLPIRRRC